jgi:hypothetical protein
MASAIAKKPCAKCQKGGGVTTCDGCQQSFCIKHIIEHREELATQMDDIGQEHDSLRRDLIPEDLRHPLLSQIDEWEQTSITKIHVAAEAARRDLRQLLNQTKNDVKTSVDKIVDELQTHRGLDDYTEVDLTRWSTKLTEVRKLIEAPLTIEIVADPNISTVIYLIKVHEQTQLHLPSNSARVPEKNLLTSQKLLESTQEKFGKVTDLISLSENDPAATYADECYSGFKTIFGKNLYHSSVYNIHFRTEKKSDEKFFLELSHHHKISNQEFSTNQMLMAGGDSIFLLLMGKDKNSAMKTSFKQVM